MHLLDIHGLFKRERASNLTRFGLNFLRFQSKGQLRITSTRSTSISRITSVRTIGELIGSLHTTRNSTTNTPTFSLIGVSTRNLSKVGSYICIGRSGTRNSSRTSTGSTSKASIFRAIHPSGFGTLRTIRHTVMGTISISKANRATHGLNTNSLMGEKLREHPALHSQRNSAEHTIGSRTTAKVTITRIIRTVVQVRGGKGLRKVLFKRIIGFVINLIFHHASCIQLHIGIFNVRHIQRTRDTLPLLKQLFFIQYWHNNLQNYLI